MLRKLCLSAVVIGALVVSGSTAAHAAKRPSGGTPSISLNESDPHLGGSVSFATTYPSTVKSPRVAVRCYQAGSLTYAEAGPADTTFTLGGGGSVWLSSGGPANCTAELFYFVWKGNNPQEYYSLAWTSFDAVG
jgi:hypothetical protein